MQKYFITFLLSTILLLPRVVHNLFFTKLSKSELLSISKGPPTLLPPPFTFLPLHFLSHHLSNEDYHNTSPILSFQLKITVPWFLRNQCQCSISHPWPASTAWAVQNHTTPTLCSCKAVWSMCLRGQRERNWGRSLPFFNTLEMDDNILQAVVIIWANDRHI